MDAKHRNVPLCCIDTITGHRTAGSWHPLGCICKRFVYALFITLLFFPSLIFFCRRNNGRGEAGAPSRMFACARDVTDSARLRARWDGTHRTEARAFRWHVWWGVGVNKQTNKQSAARLILMLFPSHHALMWCGSACAWWRPYKLTPIIIVIINAWM